MPNGLEDVEYQEVMYRLTLYAYRLFGAFAQDGVAVLKNGEGGESPEDLAMTALGRFLDPGDRTVKWDGKKGGDPTTKGVIAYLRTVLHPTSRLEAEGEVRRT